MSMTPRTILTTNTTLITATTPTSTWQRQPRTWQHQWLRLWQQRRQDNDSKPPRLWRHDNNDNDGHNNNSDNNSLIKSCNNDHGDHNDYGDDLGEFCGRAQGVFGGYIVTTVLVHYKFVCFTIDIVSYDLGLLYISWIWWSSKDWLQLVYLVFCSLNKSQFSDRPKTGLWLRSSLVLWISGPDRSWSSPGSVFLQSFNWTSKHYMSWNGHWTLTIRLWLTLVSSN